MDNGSLLKIWDTAWTEGLWYAPWSRVLEGVSPEQAAWRPGPGRHCVWEHVHHVLFWREVAVRRARGETVPKEECERRNFDPPPADATAEELAALQRRFEQSHREVRETIADPHTAPDRLIYLPYHDSYHIGQTMLLRALQGLPPID